ncbi:HDOD domain-containing protein [Leptolyngbya sp. 15MV]|nr:HDOD domain-containing protein [Leptolyngbya sp. 15MV]
MHDEAFLSGLIHDIGLMVEMQYDRNKLIEVVEQLGTDDAGVPANDMLTIEEQVFGANHQHFGAGLCQKWKFPATFALVTGYHHLPLELGHDNRTLPCLIYVADRLSSEATSGFRLDLLSTELAGDVRDVLGLGDEKLAALRQELPEHLKSAETMLS